jgi:superfamily II RNA helicase
MSKRGNDGQTLLSSNAMLQMAGRAGRRGIDDQGHVVIVQTSFEGAEDAVRCILTGPEPLVSQFTTTYGMVLNLLAVSFKVQEMHFDISHPLFLYPNGDGIYIYP